MKARFGKDCNTIVLIREGDDPRFYGIKNAKGESQLFYHVVKFLNANGFDLIKKRAWKDGHLVDEMQQYIRTRKLGTGTPDIYIINSSWALEGAEEDWNRRGYVILSMAVDIWERGQQTYAMIEGLCKNNPFLEWIN